MTDKEMASNYADTVKCEWENDTSTQRSKLC